MGPLTMCRDENKGAKCDSYEPAIGTRILQLVRLRPFVARIREGSRHPRVLPPSNPAPPKWKCIEERKD